MRLWGIKFVILVNLGQIMRDILHAINASAEIKSVLEIVPNWMKEATWPALIYYWERHLSHCTLHGVGRDDFHKKKSQI